MNIQENISLKPYNTFGVEVIARYFTEATNDEELLQAVEFSKQHHLPMLLLGGGSNILLTDNFEGIVIVIKLKGIREKAEDENTVLVSAAAGENWHQFVLYCLGKNYGGLENLSLIPGNVGTSPMQNIGAYGTEIKDTFVSCRVLNTDTMKFEIFDREKCRFGYRDSIFKHEAKNKYIITEVTFRLTRKDHKISVDYGAIQEQLRKNNVEHPTIQQVSEAVIQIRESKLPDPKKIGNSGSFFKNPVIAIDQYELIKKLHPDLPGYSDGEKVKIPAGWLIEKSGWKGKQTGNVATHALQALVIINATGKATGREIYDFSTMIINSVKENFGIELEREVNIRP